MKYNVTVVGIRPHEDLYYDVPERPYWEIESDRLNVYVEEMVQVSTHMPGTFCGIIVELVLEEVDETLVATDKEPVAQW